jgi:hypothetical protein
MQRSSAGGPGRWRIARRTAPDRIVSTVDPESRHTHKSAHAYRDGYNAHVAAERDTGLVTDIELTPGNTSDAEAATALIDTEPAGTDMIGHLGDTVETVSRTYVHWLRDDRDVPADILDRMLGPAPPPRHLRAEAGE